MRIALNSYNERCARWHSLSLPDYRHLPHWQVLLFNYIYPGYREKKEQGLQGFYKNFYQNIYNNNLLFIDTEKYKRWKEEVIHTEYDLGIRYMIVKQYKYDTKRRGRRRKKEDKLHKPCYLIMDVKNNQYYYCKQDGKYGIVTLTEDRFATWDTIMRDLNSKLKVSLQKYSVKRESVRPIWWLGKKNKIKRLK